MQYHLHVIEFASTVHDAIIVLGCDEKPWDELFMVVFILDVGLPFYLSFEWNSSN